jgi:hypothetical protein
MKERKQAASSTPTLARILTSCVSQVLVALSPLYSSVLVLWIIRSAWVLDLGDAGRATPLAGGVMTREVGVALERDGALLWPGAAFCGDRFRRGLQVRLPFSVSVLVIAC